MEDAKRKEMLGEASDTDTRESLGRLTEILNELKEIGSKLGVNRGLRESGASNLEGFRQMFVSVQDVNSQMNQSSNPHIFEVPLYIKGRNPAAYEPKMVSIGPYHYGKAHLMPMQDYKKTALVRCIRKYNVPMESYIEKLMDIVDDVRKSYEQLDQMKLWQDDIDLVKLMMLDGFFLLEYLSVLGGNQNDSESYDEAHPILGHRGSRLNCDAMMEDLLMLENQLPYKVLFTLCYVSQGEVTRRNETYAEIKERIVDKLSKLMFNDPRISNNVHHLLDTYKSRLLTKGQNPEAEVKVSASVLQKYGIQFEAVEGYNEMEFEERPGTLKLAAYFWSGKKRTLKLPPIVINEGTIAVFYNLKMYELRNSGDQQEWSSYIHLIDALVQSPEDISLLESQGIIVSDLVSHKEVRTVIKKLKKDTAPNPQSKSIKIRTEVKNFSKRKTASKRTRVQSKLATLEGIASLILLLTILQALYAVLSYHKGKNP